jgi:hypothetical protein
LLFAVGQIVSSLASNYVTLMAARFASGLGAALFSPHALGAAALLAPPEVRGRAVEGPSAWSSWASGPQRHLACNRSERAAPAHYVGQHRADGRHLTIDYEFTP